MFNRKKNTIKTLKNNIQMINNQKLELKGENVRLQMEVANLNNILNTFKVFVETMKEQNKINNNAIKLLKKELEELHRPKIFLRSQSPIEDIDNEVQSATFIGNDDGSFEVLTSDEQLKPKKGRPRKKKNDDK